MRFACALFLFSAVAAGQQQAIVTGRVFDSFHRPVPTASVVPMERRTDHGKRRLVAGTAAATVDEGGMYRLALPPGRYILAVIPPVKPLDFTTVFPAYLGDITDPERAPTIEVRAGELRPFVDFLLLEVEPHRVLGQVTGINDSWPPAPVALTLYLSNGYAGPLRTVVTDKEGRFVLDRIPAGSYELKAAAPVTAASGLDPQSAELSWYGSVHIEVRAPEITGLRIQLHPRAR